MTAERAKSAHHTGPIPIGWCEYVDLPDWEINGLRAKIDTGARSSSLHVDAIEELPRGRVAFDVILHRKERDRRVRVIAKITRRSRVRPSSGKARERYFVETTLRIGDVEKRIEVNLVDRGEMIFRMLLGRTSLGGFSIDAGKRYLLGTKPKSHASKKAKKKRRQT